MLVTIAVFGILNTAWANSDEAAPRLRLMPETLFLKTGVAEKAAAVSVGGGWDKSDWLWSFLPETLSLAFEVEIGHWQTFNRRDDRHDQSGFTQFGVTPMLRLPLAASPQCEWFVEGGIGFHFVVPLYRNQEKHFSTSFNFQDLIGIGVRYGKARRHELTLYVSHFSNANINQPNPGENFLQLRYLRYFD